VLLAGCEYANLPFQPEDKVALASAAFRSGAASGVSVAPVEGLPEPAATALAEAVATGLRDRDVPAAVGVAARTSYRLYGTAGPADPAGRRSVRWRIVDPAGRTTDLGAATPAFADPALAGDLRTLRQAGLATAAAVERSLRPDEERAPGPARTATLRLTGVAGAPADGDRALAAAMASALRAGGHALVGAEQPDALLLSGRVELGPPREGRQAVRILWLLRRPSGEEIGRLTQSNMVPAGSLEAPWGAMAEAIAGAAAPGLGDLLRQAGGAGG